MRGMSDFEKEWNSMSVEQRAQHIVRDWQDCRESNDPMVMRVAAVVAHAVLSEAIVELNTLRAERDEVRQSYCSLMEAYRGGDGRVTDDRTVVTMSARDLWRMASDHRGRNEP